MRETEVTRAIRRAQHDTYAPFVVRPALRGDVRRRDLFERCEGSVNLAGALAILAFVALFLRWAFTGW